MRIEAIDFQILEREAVQPEWRPLRTMREYPESHKARFGHQLFDGEGIQLEASPPMRACCASAQMRTSTVSYTHLTLPTIYSV